MKNPVLQNQGILLALSAMLTFSINDGIFKYSLQRFPLETVTFTGYFFSLLYLGIYGVLGKNSFYPKRYKNIFAYGFLFLLEQSLFLFALKNVPLAELFVVILATPVAVLILASLILKEHLSRREIFSIFLGLAGAFIVVGLPVLSAPDPLKTSVPLWGWIAAGLNVLAGSGKIIYLRKCCQEENNFSLSFFAILFVAIAYGALLPSSPLGLSWLDLTLLFLGGCIGGWGCTAYIRAFQFSKAALISATQYSQILWALLMGVFIFKEPLTPVSCAGSILILASGYFLYLKKRPGIAASMPPPL